MKYTISQKNEYLVIKISGHARNNEALLAKRLLSPHLRAKEGQVMIDLGGISQFEPASLLGVLSGIRKEVNLRGGELRLCSLNSDVWEYFTKNRLDRIFRFVEEAGENRKSKRSRHDQE